MAATPTSRVSQRQTATSRRTSRLGLYGQRAGVDHDEVGAVWRHRLQAGRRQRLQEHVALGLVHCRQPGEIALAARPVRTRRHCFLQRRRHGKGDPLVRHQDCLRQLRRGNRPADLPAGDGEGLAGAAQRDRAFPHAGQGGDAHMLDGPLCRE